MSGVKADGLSKRGARARVRDGKRPPRAGGNRITVQKYKEMYEAYIEHQSAAFVAGRCGVNERTAVKYIEEGDPERGLIALAERFRRVREEAARAEDLSLAKANRETSALVKASKAAWGKKLQDVLSAKNGLDGLDPNQIVKNLKLISEMEQELLVDVAAKEKPWVPVLTPDETREAAWAVIRHRNAQAKLKREAEQGQGQAAQAGAAGGQSVAKAGPAPASSMPAAAAAAATVAPKKRRVLKPPPLPPKKVGG